MTTGDTAVCLLDECFHPWVSGMHFEQIRTHRLASKAVQALRSAYLRMQIVLRLRWQRASIANYSSWACFCMVGHELGRRPLGAVDTRAQLPGLGSPQLRLLCIYMPDVPERAFCLLFLWSSQVWDPVEAARTGNGSLLIRFLGVAWVEWQSSKACMWLHRVSSPVAPSPDGSGAQTAHREFTVRWL